MLLRRAKRVCPVIGDHVTVVAAAASKATRPSLFRPAQGSDLGQVRRVPKTMRREVRRRAAVEPVIDDLKDDLRITTTSRTR